MTVNLQIYSNCMFLADKHRQILLVILKTCKAHAIITFAKCYFKIKRCSNSSRNDRNILFVLLYFAYAIDLERLSRGLVSAAQY